MLTYNLIWMDSFMFVLWDRLTDDQHIPMPFSAQHQMGSNRHPNERAMQLDFEPLTQLGGDLQACISFGSKSNVLTILTQLYGVPAVRGLESRKSNGHTKFFQLEVPIERFT